MTADPREIPGWRVLGIRVDHQVIAAVAATGLLVMVLVKTQLGPGVHPTVHRLMVGWGMWLFFAVAIVGVATGAVTRSAGLATWVLRVLAVIGVMWFSFQIGSSRLPMICVSTSSDTGTCLPNPGILWVSSVIGLAGAAAAVLVAIGGSVRLFQINTTLGGFVAPALCLASMVAVLFASAWGAYIPTVADGGAMGISMVVVGFATAVLVGVLEAIAIQRQLRRPAEALERLPTAFLTGSAVAIAAYGVGAWASVYAAPIVQNRSLAETPILVAAGWWGPLELFAILASVPAAVAAGRSGGRVAALALAAVVVCGAVGLFVLRAAG